MGYYLIQIYIPASLIVVISWVSFWLHRNATPARVSLGVTTVLTMTTLMSSTNAALPKISYVKSIDIYLGTCFVMVFASLLEYAAVGYLGKRIAMRKARCQQLAKLAEEHRQKRIAASTGEPGSEPLLASPEVPVVKTVMYIPAGLIVVTSWVSFWLHRNASPARVALGVLTVLTMTTLMSSTNAALPKISYVKSIDIYLGTCFVMVFAALLEYATVGYLGKRISMKKAEIQQPAKPAQETRPRNYSRLVCEIRFARSMGYYLIQIYIPAGLIVVISWVSFWLHRNASPARVALGVTTVLTMTTLMSSTNAALPKISYVKSIDVYLGTCFVMVFTALLEYATVGYLGKRITMRKTRCQQLAKLAEQHRQRVPVKFVLLRWHPKVNRGKHHQPDLRWFAEARTNVALVYRAHAKSVLLPLPHKLSSRPLPLEYLCKSSTLENTVNGAPDIESAFCKNPNKLFGVSPSDIDKYSRVVFPVCFVCFNLMYWIIYLHISDVLPDDVNDE
ncbi:gaba receptor invertebrate, putative [Ixodes scapularis]|uniref:Gaba receptor invertebrate, putative n=1 Tax=Ixodes scapularis TaxID=6945 RepID=B7Q4M2_IXOSC|nr:gaba receptor invertebrate, putative [Ixodes scapularis]|eukprot:XP_002411565.1 gaba receptor invertebrate, putative [Ixodes scapularis]